MHLPLRRGLGKGIHMSKNYKLAFTLLGLSLVTNGVQRFFDKYPLAMIALICALISLALSIKVVLTEYKARKK